MKWSSLLKDLREKVGLSRSSSHDRRTQSAVQRSTSPSPGYASAVSGVDSPGSPPRSSGCDYAASSPTRGHELELHFRKFWEEFRSSSSEMEKEEALNMAVDTFCKLAKQQTNVAQLITKLIETHIFSFVVGRAFVTDVEKLRICNKGRSWNATNIISFFSEVKDGIRSASNLLFAVEVLVTGATTDMQPLLDSGILCCLIHILKALMCPDESKELQTLADQEVKSEELFYCHASQVPRLEIEGSVVHIMKALASHPSAASSLAEDDSLQILFHMVTNGSLTIPQFKDDLVPLHTVQLYRHAMQILSLLLASDNGSTASYIRKHHLINVLLVAVKDFNPDRGDAAYTIGIIDLLLECIELSHRPESGSIRLREDIRNAHGYQFLVQFALKLSSLQKNHTIMPVTSKLSPEEASRSDDVNEPNALVKETQADASIPHLSPALSRLLDVLVNFAQTGPMEPESEKSKGRVTRNARSLASFDTQYDGIWETGNSKVKDLEAIQTLQDIFLKAENMELQAEVLNRIFKIFSCHLENYVLCQQLRTVPLLVLNMAGFPPSLQELILKILEYAGTVLNCIPEQELLSLCCLLQQPITTCLKHNILSFFIKLLAFDQQYKKVLREVGVLDVLLDDLKQHKFSLGLEEQNNVSSTSETKSNSRKSSKQVENTDAMLSSQDSTDAHAGEFSIFEDEATIDVGWDCLFSLLSTSETNQQAFRSSAGFNIILPFIVLDSHRPGVLCVLSCLIIEDTLQAQPKELGTIIEILKSGMVTSVSGSQYKLHISATCDTFGALCRILGSSNSAQQIFGESTGFSLLLTTLHSYQSSGILDRNSSLLSQMKVFSSLMRAITTGVSNSMINRLRLHTVLSSQTFYDLLCESGLLCMEYEKQVIQLLFDLALETLLQPSSFLQFESVSSSNASEDESSLLFNAWNGSSRSNGDRIYNASAISVLIRSLTLFTPQVQLDVLKFIEKLVHAGHFNQENLTSVGCVGLMLEAMNPFQESSSPLLTYALQIIEVLGAFRLSSSELRIILRYILQVKVQKSKCLLVNMVGKLICRQDVRSGCVSLAPFVEMDMRKFGHASIQVSLGERTWPPAGGYTFVCWFQYQNFKHQVRESEQMPKNGCMKRNASSGQILHLFSVGAVDDESIFYAELCLQGNGVFTLATSNTCSLSFPGIELEEGRWHHLAVVHNKPNALTGLFQASTAYLYINGKLMQTGRLGYSLPPVGKLLQVTLGTPASHAKTNELQWRLRCCYLFEEVLTSGNIYFMYILGRGYRGLFQDTDLLRFVPSQACGGGSLAIFDSLEAESPSASSTLKIDGQNKLENTKSFGNGSFWDMEWLMNLSSQLSGKKLIFAFDGTSSEVFQLSGTVSLLNLVDPMSAAASPIGGIPRYGYLFGDTYICNQRVIGDSIHTVGGMAVVLALVEAAETRDMLHMSLELLACSLHQNPQNVKDMKILRGYHLLALFLHCKMSLFDMHSLDIFFCIAACETSFSAPHKSLVSRSLSFSAGISSEASLDDFSLPKFSDDINSIGSHGDLDDFSAQKDSSSHISEIENADLSEDTNCIFLSNTDMVEHVLLDWTLWIITPVSIQIALLGFLERLVSMHRYKNHNLTLLRQINFLQHLLVTLQRGDVEVPVLEKLVVLLSVILEDGLLPSELDLVINFVTMTFSPPKVTSENQIVREGMGKHVIVRNMLLEMLIGLQVTIKAEDLLDQWHNNVSSKLIHNFLDETLHPSSMRWIMTLLGVCLSSSSTFALKFRVNGGYQGLSHVLLSFYDSPEIYYILFCLVFGKDVYPRLPEVRMLDFLALLPSDGKYNELKFVDLLEIVISMVKVTFDRLYLRSMLAHQSGDGGLITELIEETVDMAGDLQGEALMHKTYAARLIGGEAGAPIAATAILRFMVDLAKTCPPFSSSCKRTEFLESCVDLYFSCVRAGCALKEAKYLTSFFQDANLNGDDDSSKSTTSTLPPDKGDSLKTSMMTVNLPQEQKSTSSEDIHDSQCYLDGHIKQEGVINLECLNKDNSVGIRNHDDKFFDLSLTTSDAPVHLLNSNGTQNLTQPTLSSSSFNMPYSSNMSEKLDNRMMTDASPVSALASHSSSARNNSDSKAKSDAVPSIRSNLSIHELDASPDTRSDLHGSSAGTFLPLSAKLLLEVDDSGYGGGPCSAGATAVLDFIAEVLADTVLEQLKATQFIESILEAVPMYVDVESSLVFQGLCLGRLLNFFERHLLRDDEEDESKFDKSRWSVNLDSLCWMIVDRVYMGSFPEPLGVFRTLEFLLSMLQLANKDGRIEEAEPPGKGILSIARGSKQLESYIHAILKNTNRIIMYCFLPSFLKSIGEYDMLTSLSIQSESGRNLFSSKTLQDESVNFLQKKDESVIDICRILQLVVANKRIILCSINLDIDLISCLCTNLIALLRDKRTTAQNLAADIIKYLLLHCRSALEELFVSKSNYGKALDVLHGGFDRLLIGNLSEFFEWFHNSAETINKVLEHCSSIMWVQYVAGSAKFPGVRIKGMEVRRKREVGKKSRDAAKFDVKLWEQIAERRATLHLLHHITLKELRVIYQDKFGWVLHAENEWHTQVQQLVHERGIFSSQQLSLESEWKLCPIEGPYRMRKKFERCKLKTDTIQNVLIKDFKLEEVNHMKEKKENSASSSDSDTYFDLVSNGDHDKSFHNDEHAESIKEEIMIKILSFKSAQDGWNNDYYSSIYEPSLHSTLEFGAKSSSFSLSITDSVNAKSEQGSPRQVSSMKIDGVRTIGVKQEKELVDNGEYLIRPYLEHSEKIRFKYNCERVVGLDKHDGIFLIGDLCLYVIENFFVDFSGCIREKESEDDLSVIDQALGVKGVSLSNEFQFKSTSTIKSFVGGRARAYSKGTWGKDKFLSTGNLPHQWHMWKLDSIHELLKRDYQLRPVAIEIFSTNGCNDLLVFHKKEREEVFRNLIAKNLPRTNMLDMTISGSSKQERNEGSRLFKIMAKSFSKRWQNGEISNFQYLMHLNTLAGRGYSDLTQYPVFPWVLANYEGETLDFKNPRTFRKFDKPMGCQTPEGEDEFRKRYESWDDPDVPKFHYGSHYSSAGIVLFYLIRLPPFSTENQKLQGGQFDHADRLFNNIRDTWLSASGKSNTSDVKELIPEFFYMPEFLENHFNLDMGIKQSGEKVGNVVLPPWAKGSAREFIQRHREALESDYVSGNLHHWIDLIFGYKQRGKAAEEAVNVFYHYTYEGNVDIDSVSDPTMKASILAQINHFGQTPKQLFRKPHVKRRSERKFLHHPLRYNGNLVPEKIRHDSSPVFHIVILNEKILTVGVNSMLKPVTFSKYISWGFPDRSLRIMSYDQDKLLSTHENLHGGNQIQCAGVSQDGQFLVTGADDGVVAVWRFGKGVHADNHLTLERTLCAHLGKITCLYVSQPYSLIVTGSEDCSLILWDLTNLVFVKQLPLFPAPISAVHVNGLTGEILTAAGILLAVWSINGDCLAVVNTSQLPSDMIFCVTSATHSDWQDINWFVTGHQSGTVKVWKMVHCSTSEGVIKNESPPHGIRRLDSSGKTPEYKLVLHKVLKYHKYPVTALHLPSHVKQLLSGDTGGNLVSWTLPDDSMRPSKGQG